MGANLVFKETNVALSHEIITQKQNMRVDMTGGKFRANWKARLYVWSRMAFRRKAKIHLNLDMDVLHNREEAYCKVAGWSNLLPLSTGLRRETIVVIRVHQERSSIVELAEYRRDKSSKGEWYIADWFKFTPADLKLGVSFIFEIERKWNEIFPAQPWNGGSTPSEDDWSYKLNIE